MNGKFLLAVVVTSLIAFFGGWLIFGFVFADYYSSNLNASAMALTKDPPAFWAIALSNVAWSLLLVWVLHNTASRTFVTGFLTSLGISGLIMIAFDLSMYAFWDFYNIGFLIVDVFVGSLFWGLIGGIGGAILGSGRNVVVTTEKSRL